MRGCAKFLPGVIFCALVALSAVRASDDSVEMAKGEPIKGVVTKDEVDGVEVRVGGGRMNPPLGEILSIKFDVPNMEYMEGMRAYNGGNFADAAGAFEVLTQDEMQKQLRPVVQPYVFFLAGDSLYRSGKHKEAAEILTKYMEKFPRSRYVPRATERLVDAAIQSGKFKDVPALLSKLKALGAEMAAKATCFEGDLLRAQGKADLAVPKYEEAARTATDTETRSLARLGVARCAIEKNDYAKARQMAEQALEGGSMPVVAATAHLIIGNALLGEANAATGEPAQEKYLDAVLEFLRIPVVYGGDERTEPEALFNAGMCFQRLSKFPGRTKDKRRAAGLYSTVIRNYTGSAWAAKARENMKSVQ
ncbi:MAG: tetratricopeptide repeat protein [Planctomycetes bacterium]|nr:tetratricopeptide repeat protein [Planctomycetota bacterium]